MPVVVGTDVYGTFAQAQAYHAMRGNVEWAGMAQADGEIHLVNATEWLDRTFYGQWKGEKETSAQTLAWPREEAEDEKGTLITGIPDLLVRAMSEIAEILRSGVDLNPVLTDDSVAVKKTKVDVIEVEYDTTARLRGAPVPVHVYRMVEPLLLGSGTLLRA